MAGFGKAFSNSFENAERARASKEQDAFRVAYDSYVQKQAAYDAEKKTWDKSMTKAEQLAQQYNQPPEAVGEIAKWFAAGWSDEAVEKKVAMAKFAAPKAIVPDQASDANSIDPMAAQMGDAGLDPSAAPMDASANNNPVAEPVQANHVAEPVQANQNPDLLGSLTGPDGLFKNMGKSDAEQAQGSVMESVGINQAQFDQVNQGFTPPESPAMDVTFSPATEPVTPQNLIKELGLENGVNAGKLGSAKAIIGQLKESKEPADIKKVAMFEAMLPELELAGDPNKDPIVKAEALKLINPLAPELTQLADLKANVKTAVQTGKELAELVEANADVLTTVSGGVSGFEGFKTELAAGLDLIGKLGQQGADEQSMLSAVFKEIDAKVGGGQITAEQAQAYREFNAKAIRYIFAVGAAMGVEGNGFSNKDYENIKNSVLTSNNKDAFVNNMKELAKEQLRVVDNKAISLAQHGNLQLLYNEFPDIYSSYEQSLMPLSEGLADKNNAMYAEGLMDWVTSPRAKAGDPIAKPEPQAAVPNAEAIARVGSMVPRMGDVNANPPNLKPGFVSGEYVYMGGDPNLPESWAAKNNQPIQ